MHKIILAKAQFGFTLSCQCGCGKSMLIQWSDDYPSLAGEFGWMAPKSARHGYPTLNDVADAFAHLVRCASHLESIEDPGYFHPELSDA